MQLVMMTYSMHLGCLRFFISNQKGDYSLAQRGSYGLQPNAWWAKSKCLCAPSVSPFCRADLASLMWSAASWLGLEALGSDDWAKSVWDDTANNNPKVVPKIINKFPNRRPGIRLLFILYDKVLYNIRSLISDCFSDAIAVLALRYGQGNLI